MSDSDERSASPAQQHAEEASDNGAGLAEGKNTVSVQDDDQNDDDEAGLFGSDSEADGRKTRKDRTLDDQDLDSGDDEERLDRIGDDDFGEEPPAQDSVVMEVQLGRHAVPEGSDGELYLLKFPTFLGAEPNVFHPGSFQPPQTLHHSTAPLPPEFSRASVANNTLRWRRSPHDQAKLESDSRVIRWSDGSLTLQIANHPREQFELPAKSLAPPQVDPPKPTPTSIRRGRNAPTSKAYDSKLDSHTFLVTPQESAQLLRITHHLTSSLTVLPSSGANDEALARLQTSLAAAVRGNKTNADGSINMINISEDPELAKKKAEVAERDRQRAIKRRQAHELREAEKANRVLGRSGLSRGSGGLTVGGLEDSDMPSPMRRRKSGGAAASRRGRGRADSDDDDQPRGRTREDEYDKTDDFLVDSEEEEEEGEGDEDEDEEEEEEAVDADGEQDEDEPAAPAKPVREESSKSPKRPRAGDSRADDEGEAAPNPASRGKRRRVIDEDDDE